MNQDHPQPPTSPAPPGAEELFSRALEKPADQRAAFLARVCDNPAIRDEVMALLSSYDLAENGGLPPTAALHALGGGAAREVAEQLAAAGDSPVHASEQAGDWIGRYHLLEQIGEGGFGVVWMAEQREPVRRRVALKIVKPGMDTHQVIARFEQERQALAMMDHPNIARVFDGGETAYGRPFFVMELVRGTPVTAFCDREKLDTPARLRLFLQICSAVQHAHQKGIVHRDLKPANILVTVREGAEPVPKVIDFGVAKAMEANLTDRTLFTRFEQMIGTPAYMSPEQAGADAEAGDIDTRADIYALGVILYELLTGSTPFDSATLRNAAFEEVRRILRDEEPPRPSARLSSLEADRRTTIAQHRGLESAGLGRLLRGDLDWIVMKAIEKDRRRRYDTAAGLAPSRTYRFGKFVRRNKSALSVAAAVALLLVAGIAASTWQAVRATAEKQRAREAEALAKQRLDEALAASAFIGDIFGNAVPGSDEGGPTATLVEALGIARRKLETDSALPTEGRAHLQETIGNVYQSLGLYREAIPLYEAALEFEERKHGPEHKCVARVRQRLATSYADVGRREEALTMREQSLVLLRKLRGSNHPDTLWAMGNLAQSYAQLGRGEEALKLAEEVLIQRRIIHGPEHPDTLTAMQNLDVLYAHAGRHEEALSMREQNLVLTRKLHGSDHPSTLDRMHNLANTYAHFGRHEETLKMREELFTKCRKTLGPEHPRTLGAMHSLALSCRDAGRRDEALSLRKEVLALRRKILGDEHPDTLEAMHALALSYHDTGRWDEALNLHREVLALRRKIHGVEHQETLNAMGFLAIAYDTAGRKEEKLKLLEQGLEILNKLNAPDDDGTIALMIDVSLAYAECGRAEEALDLARQRVALVAAKNAADHPRTLEMMRDLADICEKTGRTAEANALRDRISALTGTRLRLREDGPPVKATLIKPGSVWCWLHPVDGADPAGSDPGFHQRFFLPDYDDTHWNNDRDSESPDGGFGYGDEGFTGVDLGTPARREPGKGAYFRHRFTTDHELSGLELRCFRDDGIIVYLDGKEVTRDNMTKGPEAYELPALLTANDSEETTVYRFPLPGVTLPAGEHVLAISLHNMSGGSSDLRIGSISLVAVEPDAGNTEERDYSETGTR